MNTVVLPAPRIFDHPWTREQLLGAAEASKVSQDHTDYRGAARTMAGCGGCVDLPRIRAMVSAVMGGTEGTYYICCSLYGAHLAISFPELFTSRQLQLLLAPLAAAEALPRTALPARAA
ncbi:hypothetical protein ACX80W_00165 [Arthrobacter sp. TMN-37]